MTATTEAPITNRPTRVPGLFVSGNRRYGRWLVCAATDPGRYLNILPGDLNCFSTIPDAEAAAVRLADVLPWTDTDARRAAIRQDPAGVRGRLEAGLAQPSAARPARP